MSIWIGASLVLVLLWKRILSCKPLLQATIWMCIFGWLESGNRVFFVPLESYKKDKDDTFFIFRHVLANTHVLSIAVEIGSYLLNPVEGFLEIFLCVDVGRTPDTCWQRYCLKMEFGYDSWKSWSCTSSCPVKVIVLLLITVQFLRVCGYDIDGFYIVASPSPILYLRQ